MTLTAMTNDCMEYNPSALINAGWDELEIVGRMLAIQDEKGFYCPHCFRKTSQLIPVRFKNPRERCKHFFHLDSVDSGKECANYSRESELHMEAKASLAEWLRFQYPLDHVEVEKLLAENNIRRKPDVSVVFRNGSKEAHEIQISYINLTDLNNRSADLKDLGYIPIWYLHKKNWSQVNREYLKSKGIQYYRLFVEDDKIRWEADTNETEKKKLSVSGQLDSCGRRPKTVKDDELKHAHWLPSNLDVDLDSYVRHALPHVPKHAWIGQVVWISPEWNLADVKWLVIPGTEKPGGLDSLDRMSRLAKINKWAEKLPRTNDPQRFPVSLLERMEIVNV